MRVVTILIAALLVASAGAAEEAALSDVAARIHAAALESDTAYELLGELCDRHPSRLSGSEGLEQAIDWCVEQMQSLGFSNVRKEEVMVPHWVRGEESARLIEPVAVDLNILGLGRSVGTPDEGIRAEVVVVSNFDELDALADDAIRGRIVLYDAPFVDYGTTVRYRGDGASRAAKRGAVAVLVRSVGPISYDTPHTGSLRYADDLPRIPAAAVTIEAATMMHRMQQRGDRIVVELKMQAEMLEDALSHNVVGELPGRETPEEIVLVSGHLDAWDVGQGAQDDGAGCMISIGAVALLRQLELTPRRTIRVVLWTNEENGLEGAKHYVRDHADELELHVAAIESDSGNGIADGFRVDVHKDGFAHLGEGAEAAQSAALAAALQGLEPIRQALEPLGAGKFAPGGSGADVGALARKGVLCFGLDHDWTNYFDVHHTRADTFEKIVKADLDHNVAAMAAMAFALAEAPSRALPWIQPAGR